MNITNKNTIGKITNLALVFLLSGILTTSAIFAGLGNTNVYAQETQKYYVSFAGDWTCSAAAQANGNNLKTHNVEYLQGLGDYAYETDQTCWIEDVIGDKVPVVKVAQGNHESSKEDGNDASWTQLKEKYAITNNYYVMEFNNLYTIVLNTQESLKTGSDQYNFLQLALQDAKQKKTAGTIDYVVIATHKMLVTCEIEPNLSAGSGCGDHSIEEVDGYQDIIKLLYQYADTVDLLASGHDHNTQMSKPLAFIDSQLKPVESSDPMAINFGVFGGAGRTLDALPKADTKPLWQYLNGADRQVPIFELDNEGKQMNVKFYKSSGEELFSANLVTNSDSPPPLEEICGDGIDNNNNGQVDEGCQTPTEICGDLIDNDGDGMIDEGCNVPQPNGTKGKLIVTSATATAQDSGKEIDKALDNNCDTRWSASGVGQKATFKFNNTYIIEKIRVDGYHQDKAYQFKIDGKDKLYTINANGNVCPDLEEFYITDQNIKADSITIVGQGNTGSDYNSYREIEFYGKGESTQPLEEICGDGIDNNENGQVDEGCTPTGNNNTLTHDNIVKFLQKNPEDADFRILGDKVTLLPTLNQTEIEIIGYGKVTNP